jgi:putative phosphoribosyl transferase
VKQNPCVTTGGSTPSCCLATDSAPRQTGCGTSGGTSRFPSRISVRAPARRRRFARQRDTEVIELNAQAFDELHCVKEIAIIPGATHLFPEPGAMEEVTRLARDWFVQYVTTVRVSGTIW